MDSHKSQEHGSVLSKQIHQATNMDSTCPNEAIAIVGMACRLPGDIKSPSELWNFLINGRSAHSEVPPYRFNSKSFYNANPDFPGSINSTGGYFIQEDLRLFDNGFFGINNLEAKYMDPQQRKLLEVVWECLESSGTPIEQLSGSNTGCFVANFTIDFLIMQSKDPEAYHRYSATGMGSTILANRISHVFDLKGPTCVLDTACSSSLYSLHQACSALNLKECDGAIIAGANLIQTLEMHMCAVKAGILSGTSTSHSFDSSADGYGRAEGVGALYVKRLSDAIKDGDPIRSVIRGIAVNSNGKTNGISQPSASGQEAVIRKAYVKAGLPLDRTDYIEAHGTGTAVGDPIEVDGISRVFAHADGRPLLIGSLKPSLGHSEAVSGITSIIKVALALEKGVIPPTIGIENLNPALKLEERNIEVVQSPTTWPESHIKRAGVNSFGYGGANSHVILEPPPVNIVQNGLLRGTGKSILIFPFSAHSQASLLSRVENIVLDDVSETNMRNLAYTLISRRSKMPVRGYIIAPKDNVSERLNPSNLRMSPGVVPNPVVPIAFIFTGQGAQWPRMGHDLLHEFPTFRQTIHDLDSVLALLPDPPSWSLYDVMQEPGESVHSASHSQPMNTALQIALVTLLREWNVRPQVVIGHSSGEIAAAFAAGHLTPTEAIKIAYYRGLIVSRSPLRGAMVAAALSPDAAKLAITELRMEEQVRVACVNAPQSVTLCWRKERSLVLYIRIPLF